jgi:hypothetical protein
LLIFLVRSYRRDPDGLRLWLHPPIEAPAAASAAPAPRAGVAGGGVRGTQSKRRKRR